MNEWTIYPSINNHNHYAVGSPDGRELKRGEAVEILLGGFRIPGFIEYSPNGDYFAAMTGQSICGLYPGMKLMVMNKFTRHWNVGADLSRPPPIYRPNGEPGRLGLLC